MVIWAWWTEKIAPPGLAANAPNAFFKKWGGMRKMHVARLGVP
jgi:hypothetical protein